jgi:hypothetical protein
MQRRASTQPILQPKYQSHGGPSCGLSPSAFSILNAASCIPSRDTCVYAFIFRLI